MTGKVYPMDENYNQVATKLVELIEARDLLAKSLKIAHPSKLRDGQRMLADADKKIEACESVLAKKYETYQLVRREKEKLEASMGEIEVGMEGAFIYIKHCLPDSFELVKTVLFTGWSSKEIDEFNDRIAVLEATKFEEFIAEKKDDD